MGTFNVGNLGHPGRNLIPMDKVNLDLLARLPRRTVTQNLKRNNRVNIRIREEDVFSLQQKALESGVPFQSYVADILHRFAEGDLQETRS